MKEKRSKKILVAEDDRFLVQIYESKFKCEGIETLKALNGRDCVKIAHLEQPALIVLDLIMPVKSGFEALAELKKNSKTMDIPVIVLSNLGQDSAKKRAKKLGAHEFIVKSNVSLHDVVGRIKEYLDEMEQSEAA